MKQTIILQLNRILFLLALLFSRQTFATDVATLLQEQQSPAGVVFEIVSDEDDLLKHLLPTLKKDIEKLRHRFPGIEIAIVTHGKEQFTLTRKNSKKDKVTHSLVKDMVEKNDIEVHVCGTHASWYGVTPEDFPDYVDVSAAGPAQINDYEEMGYEVIVLTE